MKVDNSLIGEIDESKLQLIDEICTRDSYMTLVWKYKSFFSISRNFKGDCDYFYDPDEFWYESIVDLIPKLPKKSNII